MERSEDPIRFLASLHRTRQVMSDEIQRVTNVSKLMNDGREALASSHQEYSSVKNEIQAIRKQLVHLQVRLLSLYTVKHILTVYLVAD